MRRLMVAVGIFFMMIAICAAALIVVKKERDEYMERLDEIYLSAYCGYEADTIELIEKFNADWQREEHRISRLLRIEQLDELTAIFSQLAPLYQYEDKAEFFSELERGKTVLDHIWLAEIPNTMNIL